MALMEYDGYNGRLTVEGQVLTLVHRGMAAGAGGLATDHPRRIPLQAVSGVAFRAAKRLTNGHLTLGLGGAQAAELGATSAGSDPNTILFGWKDRASFQTLHTWLQSVVEYNRANGVDCAAVSFDPPLPTRLDRIDPRRSDSAAPPEVLGSDTVDGEAPIPASDVLDFRAAPPPTGPAIVLGSGQSAQPVKLGRRERSEKRAAFQALAMAAACGDVNALESLPGALDETRRHWRNSKLQATLWEVLSTAIQHVGADDVLTVEEEGHLVGVADALGLTFYGLRSNAPRAFEQLVVCRINDGRPPTLEDAPILTRGSEVAYGSFSVSLMKEVVQREFRGGSSGVSIPIGFGIRYRTGSVRGKSVVVGTDLVPEDTGVLVVSSARAVYSGAKKTLEFRYDRLVDVQQYTDGLRLNDTNRQTASLFKFATDNSPTIAAALIVHAAAAS